jgi:hypothetical protein
MSVSIEAISRQCIALQKLEQQMTELLALRRAVCLLNAKRSRPKGSRRLYRASARSTRLHIWYRAQPNARDRFKPATAIANSISLRAWRKDMRATRDCESGMLQSLPRPWPVANGGSPFEAGSLALPVRPNVSAVALSSRECLRQLQSNFAGHLFGPKATSQG